MGREVIVLGGRAYVPAEDTTFEQDAHLMGLVYDAGLHAVIEQSGDLVGAVLRSGRVTEFLASVLVPADDAWTPAGAAASAAHFRGLTAPDEKAALLNALTGLLSGFFGAAPASSGASPSASPETPAPAEAEAETGAGRRTPRKRTPAGAARSASGSPSSPPSPTATGSA